MIYCIEHNGKREKRVTTPHRIEGELAEMPGATMAFQAETETDYQRQLDGALKRAQTDSYDGFGRLPG